MRNDYPEPDVAEQQHETDAEEVEPGERELPVEADPADVAEQQVMVPYDDDYDR